MRLLLDTHVWLWQLLEPERLSRKAEAALSDRASELFLSPISTWETMILARKGKIELRPTAREWLLEALRRSTLVTMPLTHDVALRSESLDGLDSQDPADRFLVATALEHDLAMVTADETLRAFKPLVTIW